MQLTGLTPGVAEAPRVRRNRAVRRVLVSIDCRWVLKLKPVLIARTHQYNRSQTGLQAFLRNGAGESLATRTSLVAATRYHAPSTRTPLLPSESMQLSILFIRLRYIRQKHTEKQPQTDNSPDDSEEGPTHFRSRGARNDPMTNCDGCHTNRGSKYNPKGCPAPS